MEKVVSGVGCWKVGEGGGGEERVSRAGRGRVCRRGEALGGECIRGREEEEGPDEDGSVGDVARGLLGREEEDMVGEASSGGDDGGWFERRTRPLA